MDKLTCSGAQEGHGSGQRAPLLHAEDIVHVPGNDMESQGSSTPPPVLFPEVPANGNSGNDELEEFKEMMSRDDNENSGQQDVELKHLPTLLAASAEVSDETSVPKRIIKPGHAFRTGTGKSPEWVTPRGRRLKGDSVDPKEQLLKIKPARIVGPRQPIPEEKKDEEYLAKRARNTEASRRSRDKKRALDAERVDLLKQLTSENQELEEDISKLEQANAVLKELILAKIRAGPTTALMPGQGKQQKPKKKK